MEEMNLLTDDVILHGIIPYLSHYDLFMCRNVSIWWREQYDCIKDKFMGSITMKDILRYNNTDIIKEILRITNRQYLISIINSRIHDSLIEVLVLYPPFIERFHMR